MHEWLSDPDGSRYFLLTGEPGSGKTAIAARLTQIRDDVAAYHFCRAGDVETVRPGRILRSLAARLGEHLPDYGQALANTIKPVHLRVEVNINIGSMTGSEVTGVYIENLKESDPENELDILIRAPLEELQKMYAERQQTQPALAIILIDALDEAMTLDTTTTIVTLLSKIRDLPNWVRLIFTTRFDLRVLSSLEFLKPYNYYLKAESSRNLADLYKYVQQRLSRSELVNQFQEQQILLEEFADQLTKSSGGNFLYATLILDEIESGERSLAPSAIPQSLDEFYYTFLGQLTKQEWISLYRPIMQILTVTQEPVSFEQLVSLTSINQIELQQGLRTICQFLNVLGDRAGEETYDIFHNSFRSFLLREESSKEFWCKAEDGHNQIVNYYLSQIF